MAGFFASLFHKKADASVSNPDEGAFVESPADDSRTASSQEVHLPTRIALCSPADGAAKSMEEVADDVFSTKVLGDGFAVPPSNGPIVAPVSGTIPTIANARHAVGNTMGERYGNAYNCPSAGNNMGNAMTSGRVAGKHAATA